MKLRTVMSDRPGVLLVPEHPVEGEQEAEPERAGQIAQDAHGQVNPAQAAQASGQDDHGVLQIALAPAPLPRRVVNHGLRRLLVASLQVAGKPDLPVFLEQQGRLHKIVAQDLPAERFAPRQLRQVAALHERPRCG